MRRRQHAKDKVSSAKCCTLTAETKTVQYYSNYSQGFEVVFGLNEWILNGLNSMVCYNINFTRNQRPGQLQTL